MTKSQATSTARSIVQEFQAGIPNRLIGPNEIRLLQLGTLRDAIREALLGSGKTARQIVAEFRAGVPAKLIGPNRLQVRQLDALRVRLAEVLGK